MVVIQSEVISTQLRCIEIVSMCIWVCISICLVYVKPRIGDQPILISVVFDTVYRCLHIYDRTQANMDMNVVMY